MKFSGKFITVEGGEGSGKSTQIKLLEQFLTENNIETITTKEPGGTEVGLKLRKLLVTGKKETWDPISETLLFFTDRRYHLLNKVFPALKQNKVVISDRFADSTLAYQHYGYENKLTRKQFDSMYELAVGDFEPDLTLILDIPVKEGLKRSYMKSETMAETELRFESMDLSFHENLRQGFLKIAKDNPKRCIVINANQSIEDVAKNIRKAVIKHFNNDRNIQEKLAQNHIEDVA
jgi:dTMP kinase